MLALATFGLAGMWFAIFADAGVAAITIINGTRAYGTVF
jgi:cation transport ATPase